jgi:hypothetical protein
MVSQATATAAARFLAENVSVKLPALRATDGLCSVTYTGDVETGAPGEQLRIPS